MSTGLSPQLRALLEASGPALSREASRFEPPASTGPIGRELQGLLAERNGFYAFESALLVRPSCRDWGAEIPMEQWNQPGLWISRYRGCADGLLFFAEDIFGGQFGVDRNGVYMFDPETGDRSLVAETLTEWAEELLVDYSVLTGYPLGHEWQAAHGRLPSRMRLVPKVPFVLGGAFECGNLRLADAVSALWERAEIARQIHGLPDGTDVELAVGDSASEDPSDPGEDPDRNDPDRQGS